MGVMLGLLTAVPLRFWLIGVLASCIAAWGFSGHWKANRLEKERAALESAQKDAQLAADKAVREQEAKLNAKAREISSATATQLRKARDTERSLVDGKRKLQSSIAAANAAAASAATSAGCEFNGTAIFRFLGESAELVEEGARRDAESVAKIAGLQRYVTEVCLAKQNADH